MFKCNPWFLNKYLSCNYDFKKLEQHNALFVPPMLNGGSVSDYKFH